MSAHVATLHRMLDPGIIPVIRANSSEHVLAACDALVAGGIKALEITMTTPNALECISAARARFPSDVITGAGTVITPKMCQTTIDAGAQFIVTPIMRPEIIPVAKAGGCPIMMGALTPTEAQIAYEAGADLVKIFPAESPGYIKTILGPLPHLKIVPTSGVSLQNGAEFLAVGCVALGVGSNLVSATILREQKWAELTRLAAEYLALVRNFWSRAVKPV